MGLKPSTTTSCRGVVGGVVRGSVSAEASISTSLISIVILRKYLMIVLIGAGTLYSEKVGINFSYFSPSSPQVPP